MLRVYLLFIISKLKTSVFFEIVVLVISFFVIASVVSIQHIASNAPHDIVNIYHFFLSAFANTRTTVQIMTSILSLSAILLLKDLLKLISKLPKYKFATAR